jgi:imidazole glycerol-phosphate synthase subunit HisF
MTRPRVIPVLLMKEGGLYKTERFTRPVYVGDPINTMRLFNDKEVDEIMVLDIGATPKGAKPDFAALADIVSESFMPLAYGGGITSADDAKKLFDIGIEKMVLNTSAYHEPKLIETIAAIGGSQSVVVSIDVKKHWWHGELVYVRGGRERIPLLPVEYAKECVARGAGEIMVTSIDCEGTMQGYDLDLIRKVAEAVDVPVIAHGGAGKTDDLRRAITEAHASAVAAGSLFVFQGPHRAVLINYPACDVIDHLFG